jgi:DNA-binding transcriptional ArsR family regulator
MRTIACVDDDGSAAGAELLKTLANPHRVRIVLELADRDGRCVHELVASLRQPQPLVSQHLRVLRTAGLIAGTRVGREVRYQLVDDHVRHIVHDAVTHAREDRP